MSDELLQPTETKIDVVEGSRMEVSQSAPAGADFILNNITCRFCKHIHGPQSLKVTPDQRTLDRSDVSPQNQLVIITTVPQQSISHSIPWTLVTRLVV
jgi:hypothetical protein